MIVRPWPKAAASICRRTRSAYSRAPSLPVSTSRTTNSSPPYRQTTSMLRDCVCRIWPTMRSVSSPAGWPSSSLIALKPSMSSITTDSGWLKRLYRDTSSSSRVAKKRRLYRPVTSSVNENSLSRVLLDSSSRQSPSSRREHSSWEIAARRITKAPPSTSIAVTTVSARPPSRPPELNVAERMARSASEVTAMTPSSRPRTCSPTAAAVARATS